MAETYLITAKTVEEAIAIAKREYEDASHEVSYEILEMPKKGLLFGIGSKDAKIKVSVTKISSVESELGSLVADIKNMKSLTDKGGSDEPAESEKKKPQQQNQKSGEKQAQNKQNQKQQKSGEKQGQKQNPQKSGDGQKQNQNKQQKPADKQNAEQKPQNQNKQNSQKQNAEKQQKQNNNSPKPQNAPKAEAQPEKAEPKVEEAPVQNNQPSEPAFGSADASYKSSLGNQGKPNRRGKQKKSSGTPHTDEASGVTVSTPVGLTDFVSESTESGFGTESSSGSGSMNNDIRKKNRQQQSQKPAEKTETEVPAPLKVKPARPRNNRSGPIQKSATEALASKYDVAESDEDYEKLDRLVAEAEGYLTQVAEPVHEERRREAITPEEMQYALDFANTLLKNMQLDASAVPAECPEGEEFDVTETATVYPKINIIGEDTGILIGHHGETLDAIQYLVNLSALRKTKSKDGDYVKIVVDIENYREKREETLRALARRMAARAVKYKRNVFLEPMNAYERRIIHSELQNYEYVSTHSVGSDRDRKIIITYEGPDKAPDNKKRKKPEDEAQGTENRSESGSGNKKSRSRNRNRNRQNANSNAAENAEVSQKPEAPAESAADDQKEIRRPKKQQKMPIEKLGEWLPDAGVPEDGEDADDTLQVLSSLRAYKESEAAEEAAETVKAAEEAAEAAESFEEKAEALADVLESLTDDE